jgi:hypothetical protein
MMNTARVIRSLFSDTGELYMKIQECEAEVKKEADIAQKQGLPVPIHIFCQDLANISVDIAAQKESLGRVRCILFRAKGRLTYG